MMLEWFKRYVLGRMKHGEEHHDVFFDDLFPKEFFQRLSKDFHAKFRFKIAVSVEEI